MLEYQGMSDVNGQNLECDLKYQMGGNTTIAAGVGTKDVQSYGQVYQHGNRLIRMVVV